MIVELGMGRTFKAKKFEQKKERTDQGVRRRRGATACSASGHSQLSTRCRTAD